MDTLLITLLALTALAALIGAWFGVRALRVPEQRLVALNLLEPIVTMLTLLAGAALVSAANLDAAWTFAFGAIPLSAMLLAPLFTSAALEVRLYGALRWTNTVLFWLVGARVWANPMGGEAWANAALTLILTGLVILWLSVLHLPALLEPSSPKAAAPE